MMSPHFIPLQGMYRGSSARVRRWWRWDTVASSAGRARRGGSAGRVAGNFGTRGFGARSLPRAAPVKLAEAIFAFNCRVGSSSRRKLKGANRKRGLVRGKGSDLKKIVTFFIFVTKAHLSLSLPSQ